MKHTAKPWTDGGPSDSIVSQSNEGLIPYGDKYEQECVDYYGGYVIAESVAPCNKPVIKAAPDLLAAMPSIPHPGGALIKVVAHYADGSTQTIAGDVVSAAVAKARGK